MDSRRRGGHLRVGLGHGAHTAHPFVELAETAVRQVPAVVLLPLVIPQLTTVDRVRGPWSDRSCCHSGYPLVAGVDPGSGDRWAALDGEAVAVVDGLGHLDRALLGQLNGVFQANGLGAVPVVRDLDVGPGHRGAASAILAVFTVLACGTLRAGRTLRAGGATTTARVLLQLVNAPVEIVDSAGHGGVVVSAAQLVVRRHDHAVYYGSASAQGFHGGAQLADDHGVVVSFAHGNLGQTTVAARCGLFFIAGGVGAHGHASPCVGRGTRPQCHAFCGVGRGRRAEGCRVGRKRLGPRAHGGAGLAGSASAVTVGNREVGGGVGTGPDGGCAFALGLGCGAQRQVVNALRSRTAAESRSTVSIGFCGRPYSGPTGSRRTGIRADGHTGDSAGQAVPSKGYRKVAGGLRLRADGDGVNRECLCARANGERMWALRFAQESQSGCAAPAGGGAIAHRGGPQALARNAVFIHLHPAIGEGVCPDGRGPYGQRLSAVAHRGGIGFGGNGARSG
ncbi:hypothetical protein G6F65_014896 [Rhizopus arrhizus]|nr:hypothetical protein G6F65_014896 [Rhizopus arrhizus]